MLVLTVLFIVGFVTGSRSEKSGDRILTTLLFGLLIAFILMWQDSHDWPGFNPAFIDQLGEWLVTATLGFLAGGVVFGGALQKDNP